MVKLSTFRTRFGTPMDWFASSFAHSRQKKILFVSRYGFVTEFQDSKADKGSVCPLLPRHVLVVRPSVCYLLIHKVHARLVSHACDDFIFYLWKRGSSTSALKNRFMKTKVYPKNRPTTSLQCMLCLPLSTARFPFGVSPFCVRGYLW